MGINFSGRVGKIVAIGSNLWPDTIALLPWTKNWIVNFNQSAIPEARSSKDIVLPLPDTLSAQVLF